MLTITPRSDGTYLVEADSGPRAIVVTLAWLNGLVRELRDHDMLDLDGIRLVRPPG